MLKQYDNDYCLNRETSEYVYTYGGIASSTRKKEYKRFLMDEVVEKSIYSEPVAHALVHLRDVFDKEDLNTIEKWLSRYQCSNFKHDPQNPDFNNRVHKYCESIYYLLKAKYADI